MRYRFARILPSRLPFPTRRGCRWYIWQIKVLQLLLMVWYMLRRVSPQSRTSCRLIAQVWTSKDIGSKSTQRREIQIRVSDFILMGSITMITPRVPLLTCCGAGLQDTSSQFTPSNASKHWYAVHAAAISLSLH